MGKKKTATIEIPTVATGHFMRKQYSYGLPGVDLVFALRQDNESELAPYVILLSEALKDVQADLAAVRSK